MPASDTFRGMPSSTLRHRPINPTTEEIEFTTPRASRPQNRQDRRTTDDVAVAKSQRLPTGDRALRRTTEETSLLGQKRRIPDDATLVKINQQPIRSNTQPVRIKNQPTRANSQSGRSNTRKKRERNIHWSFTVAVSMVAMLVLLWLGQALWSWGMVTYDDIKYGRPRTMQVDAFVGHETGTTPSHFIALNENGRIEIIELPGGDASHARIFMGPQILGSGADLAPITLTFMPSAPHSKLLNMQVSFQGSHILFLNTKGTFVLATT